MHSRTNSTRSNHYSHVEYSYTQENGTPPWAYGSESSSTQSSNQNSVACTPYHPDGHIDGIKNTNIQGYNDDRFLPPMTSVYGSALGLDVPMPMTESSRGGFTNFHQRDYWHDSHVAPSPSGGRIETLPPGNYPSSISAQAHMYPYVHQTSNFSSSAPHLPSSAFINTIGQKNMPTASPDVGRAGFSLSPNYRPLVPSANTNTLYAPDPSECESLSPIGSYFGRDEEDMHQQYYDSASSSLLAESSTSYAHELSSHQHPLYQEKVGSDRIREISSRRRTNPHKKLFTCDSPGCGATITSKHNYKSHMNSHRGIKNHECKYKQCSKRFGTFTEAKRHSEKHCKYSPNRCSST